MARSVKLVILMAAIENHLKSRHYWLAQNNAGWQSRQTGLQGCQDDKAVRPACYVWCLLLAPLFFEVDANICKTKQQTNIC
jgi:hypothetical protein